MLRDNIKFCFLFIFFYLLVGCITNKKIQKDYCEGLDTYKKGYLDASTGQSAKDFQDTINACVKYKITLDQTNYDKGYQEGIKIFCTKERGYSLGVSGQENLGICLNANSDPFSKGYEEGNKKCWYDVGYSHATAGTASNFSVGVNKCVILSQDQGKGEYNKGWKEGAKVFCTYKQGYDRGLKAQSNPGICRGSAFSKGYRNGSKKCWYDRGYSHGKNAYPSSEFSSVKCVSLSKKQNWTEYDKGWQKGMRALCTREGGYKWGLGGQDNPDVCSKSRAAQFSKGYMKGLQQYEKNKRHQQLLNLEREKIRAEQEQKQRALNLERERMRIEQMQTQQLLNLERRKAREQQEQNQQLINLERRKVREQQETREEILKLQKLGKRRLCKYNSDCGKNGRCRYDYNVRDYVCKYK